MSRKRFVVSANYRDRDSTYKYLVRPINGSTADAVACGGIKATGIQVDHSNREESGFGCSRVVLCENMEMIDIEVGILPSWLSSPEPAEVELERVEFYFSGHSFYRKDDGDVITHASEIELLPDGTMFASV